MSPTRILFPFAGNTGLGGSHVSALDLIAGLDRDRFAPMILLHQHAGRVGEYAADLGLDFEIAENLPLLRSRNSPRKGDVGMARYALVNLRRMVAEIRRLDPQIIHTNEGRIHTNWALPTRLAGRRHLWHHRQDPRAFGVNKLAPLLSDQIVSVSYFARPAAPIRNIDNRFAVVRSPFDFSAAIPAKAAARQAILTEMGLPADSLLLGWFGTLTERKKPTRFVEAVAEIARAMPDRPVHGLLFGGEVETHSALNRRCAERAAAAGIAPNIHLMGFRSPLTHYMAGVDVSLVTALNEPFGRTLIESMHLGTPVIATAHGGNPEAITDGQTGFLVEPESPAAFIAPLRRLMETPGLYDRIAQAARTDVTAKYGRETHIRQMSEIYDRLSPPRA
ncbi:glycosyltransferase family 4 protein [Paracoccus sp. S1E-3]|uniref:glycosyltransferase family 4 protein n=1 Tax=Paracoccus sp. S1E-3 TaxID=2756130 RepID=UPI0015EEF118|nr:glycosyltransferase family 4 protein [Paracoccus sp. S1E-3]MBA4490837.1 glycosyltransferase family 4 protein [Paracoccus sp. S1E-3]